jgi:hypothetical protein
MMTMMFGRSFVPSAAINAEGESRKNAISLAAFVMQQ